MLKKTVNARKKYILLRSFFATVLCLVLVCPAVFTVSAAGVDYKDYISNIEVDGHNDLVTITIPASEQYWVWQDLTAGYPAQTFPNGWLDFQGELVEGSDVDYHKYRIQLHPFTGRLNLDDIPNNAQYTAGFRFHYTWNTGYETPYVSCNEQYYSASGSWLGQIQNGVGWEPFDANAIYEVSGKLDKDGPYSNGVTELAGSVDLFLQLNEFSPLSGAWIAFEAQDFTMTFAISSLYELQQTQEKTNQILEAVEDKLEANGEKLEDILEQQQQTNDKLDKLPGEIGDEVQNVIENEKAEAESSGNDFVDQILGALPDPSTVVLSALKSLTDATSYYGTEAVLPIPAIVLPGIDGLFPETVVWGGGELDFEEYLSFLPPALLTLVQSLFTISIVIFCVYELKGIISYCLTLRESKGG
ncbi:MAG: hypothetical protein IJW94_06350 [Oscillospiraceae bacterium]|nr:hypothetical protein [Oscillospiraceae bacterium]